MVLGPVLLLVASVLGLANAAYFTLVAYGVLQETQGLGKAVCDVTKAPCAAVVDTPYAKLFGGIPNSVLGVAWHAWGLSAGLLGVRSLAIPFVRESLVAAGVTLVAGAYLVWALRVKLRMDCPLCYQAHLVNVVAAVAWYLVYTGL